MEKVVTQKCPKDRKLIAEMAEKINSLTKKVNDINTDKDVKVSEISFPIYTFDISTKTVILFQLAKTRC